MYFTQDSTLPENQAPLIITAARRSPAVATKQLPE